MFFLKNKTEIKKLEYINKLNALLLHIIKCCINIDIYTIELEEIVIKFCESYKVVPTFKDYQGFPHCLGISINDEVIHGFPSYRQVKEGDIVSVDCGLMKDGFHSDSAFTKYVGSDITDSKLNLLSATETALYKGFEQLVVGNRLQNISRAIYEVAQKFNVGVVKEFVGHGTGFYLHEDPKIPNYMDNGVSWLLKPGMVVAIEPMFVEGSDEIYVDDNGWTIRTRDGGMAAHFEHTIAITDDGPTILSKM